MWYDYYGWKANPFSIKTSTELIGLDNKKQELIQYVNNGDVCFLNGPTGVGKTSLLRWLEKNLKNHKVLYIDAAGIQSGFSLTNYLKKQNTLFNRLRGKDFPKNTVILVDESQDCDEELLKALKLHWDHNHIKSIVITQISPQLDKFSESFRHRIGERIILVGQLTSSQGYDLISLRACNKNPFDKSAIEAILEYSNHIPRKILENTEMVCMKMAGKKNQSINAFDVEDCLSKKPDFQPAQFIQQPQITQEQSPQEPQSTEQSPLQKLSPMEKSILQQLAPSDKTAQTLAFLLKTSEGSVGKQLSNLMKKNLVRITKLERPKAYGLVKPE
ncbi:MAG TPA: ATP-binding protein [Candidatus Nanoarchaeia archaeon]|nr:ATP-binding protein [Candidatus Nanoarchaeia archaeon]